jgi:hypothetical protein
MPMNPRILRPLARPLLLDAVPGAAAAYSLRQLSNSYTGPVVTVRRSSDSAEADFKASEIDDGTLAAFCGAGDGLVKTWHDQSGNGRDASQGTAAAQPKIVDSGSLVTEGGKAALEFDGTDDHLETPYRALSATSLSLFCALKADANGEIFSSLDTVGGSSSGVFFAVSGDVYSLFLRNGGTNPGNLSATTPVIGVQSLAAFTLTNNGTNNDCLIATNGAIEADQAYGQGENIERLIPFFIGAYNNNVGATAGFLTGAIQELIVYQSDQTANRQRIEGDINRHFGIF